MNQQISMKCTRFFPDGSECGARMDRYGKDEDEVGLYQCTNPRCLATGRADKLHLLNQMPARTLVAAVASALVAAK